MIGMHAPDGFLDPGVAIVTAVISIVVVGLSLRRGARDLDDRRMALAGLAAAFIFAAQMFNFPVASGTTGHLLGGALAAILLGPYLGTLVVSAVVVVQAVLFADGGLSALGYNVLNMAIVPAFGGWVVYRLMRRALPADSTGVVTAGGLAAAASVVLSSVAFSIEWLFGATAPVSFTTVFGAMVGVHALIGIGEGVLSALVIAAVLAARSDLVSGARDLVDAELVARPRISPAAFRLGGALTAVFVAVVVSQFAVDHPDGLERVAADQGFLDRATGHALADSVFADYATRGIGNDAVSLAFAGLFGVAITVAVTNGLLRTSRQFDARPA